MTASQEARIDYHLRELEIARNPECPDRVMPAFAEEDRVILDLGCGIGQTLLVSSGAADGRTLVGLDPDLGCLAYGHRQYSHLRFVNGSGENLPFASGTFDLVVSRVVLPYTHIRATLREIGRVLKTSGKVWLTLHPLSMALDYLGNAARSAELKRVVLGSYVLVNGALLHFFGRQFRFPVDGRYETFQTESGMKRDMKIAGFENVAIRRGRHFLVTGRKASEPVS
jgi:SAM-dependent methyltransferase